MEIKIAFIRSYSVFLFASIWLSYLKIMGTSLKLVDVIGSFHIVLFIILVSYRKKYLKNPIVIALTLLSLLSVVSSLVFVQNIFIGARIISSLVLPLYLTFVYPDILCRLRTSILVNIKFVLILSCLFGFFQTNTGFFWTNGQALFFGVTGRATGLFANSAHNGVFIFMLIYTYVTVSKKINKVDYFYIILGYLALFFSETRAVIGLAILAIPIYFLHQLNYFEFTASRFVPKRFFRMLIFFFILPFSTIIYFNWNIIYFVYETLTSVFVFRLNAQPNFLIDYFSEYCFPMQGEEYLDQSLGHRLERIIFVFHTVIRGEYWYGHGLGRCIGGGADNQLVRITNDLGLLGLLLNVLIYCAIAYVAIMKKNFKMIYLLVTMLFLGLFYDILYLQLSVVCLGIILAYLQDDRSARLINSSIAEEVSN